MFSIEHVIIKVRISVNMKQIIFFFFYIDRTVIIYWPNHVTKCKQSDIECTLIENWKKFEIFFHPPTSNITWKLILIDDTATWNAHQNHVEKILFLSIISNHSNLFSSHIPIIFCGSYQSQLCTSSLFRMRDEQNEYCRSIKKM